MSASVTIFRPAAIESRSDAAAVETLGVAPPWSWGVFAISAALLVAVLLLAALTHVEVTGRARGAIVPVGGVRTIEAAANGVVAEVFRSRGDRVRAGEALLRIDSAQARAGVVAADGALAAEQLAIDDEASFARQRDALQSRRLIAGDQIDSATRSIALREESMRRRAALHEAGLASETDVNIERDAVETARRQFSAARAELAQTNQQLAALDEAHGVRRRERATRIAAAAAGKDAARVPLAELVVRAPVAGTIEALSARAGNVVQSGAPLGRVVPDQAPLRVVCFLPQEDRRFVHLGDVARVELDELPKIDFGTIAARVVRISRDLAAESDVGEVLAGEHAASVYRVELEPLSASRELRAGMLLRARFVLRRERPLALLFAPLRRWAGRR
jgi:multidrug resistance efflux pump